MRATMRFSIVPIMAVLVGCQTAPTSADVSPGAKPPEANIAPPVKAAIVIPSGTPIEVRIDQALSTQRNRAGDKFNATLDQPIVSGDHVVVPRGARIQGHVSTSRSSGRLEGRAVLGVTL